MLAAPERPTIVQVKDLRWDGRQTPVGGGRHLGPAGVDDIQRAIVARKELADELRDERISLLHHLAGLQLFCQHVKHG